MLIDKYKDLNEDQRAIMDSTSNFANANIIPNALNGIRNVFFQKVFLKKLAN